MHTLRIAVGVAWAVFWVGWLLAAFGAKRSTGRNWGMPTTQRVEPELITAGPYNAIRHPIYTGILLGVVGTALVTNLIALVIAVVVGAYFVWAATVEELNLTATFPSTYPACRARTKMLIPFVL